MCRVTSMPFTTQSQVVRVYESYRRRWTIETGCFEELKRAWFLNSFPGRSFRAVYAHVVLILFMFNAIKAFLIVYHGKYVAILSLPELLEVCGMPPPGKYKHHRIKIIRPDNPR